MRANKEILVTGNCYHVYSKSIAGYKVFNSYGDFSRMVDNLRYYRCPKKLKKFSRSERDSQFRTSYNKKKAEPDYQNHVDVISYCLMPTHFHLILKQTKKDGISDYLKLVLISYTKYFNLRYRRKGPLWESRFRRRLIRTDEDLLHMTRYVHLNPVTAYLVDKAEEWKFSSYHEYLGDGETGGLLCEYKDLLDITPAKYKKFVADRTAYQRELAKIKYLLVEEADTG